VNSLETSIAQYKSDYALLFHDVEALKLETESDSLSTSPFSDTSGGSARIDFLGSSLARHSRYLHAPRYMNRSLMLL
jgi:hypothetical protein